MWQKFKDNCSSQSTSAFILYFLELFQILEYSQMIIGSLLILLKFENRNVIYFLSSLWEPSVRSQENLSSTEILPVFKI